MEFNITLLACILASLFTYGMTALGASLVYFFKQLHSRILKGMLGFASGVMIAASFWSLLNPGIEQAEALGQVPGLVIGGGFLLGGLSLYFADRYFPHQHLERDSPEGKGATSLKRGLLLTFAITLHNIPEGLAVGVAFGAITMSTEPSQALIAAYSLALGMGIQNFPEGAAVAIPLRKEGYTRTKAFLYGQASGMVEPIFALLGYWLVHTMQALLPFTLAFAAGAMIYVVAEELIPEAKQESSGHEMILGLMMGFILMMILDTSL